MRKVILSLLFCFVMFATEEAFAQTNGLSVHIGATNPVGGFSNTKEAFSDMASGHSGASYGLALGLKAQYGLPVILIGKLKLMATAELFYNESKPEVVSELNASENSSIYFDAPSPKFYNIPLMLGVNYSLMDFIAFKLFVEASAGVNFRMVSDMEQLVHLNVSSNEYAATLIQFDDTRTFAWQLGVGFCIMKRVSLGINYYNLGKTELTGTRSLLLGEVSTVEMLPDEYRRFSNGRTGSSMFVLRLGFHF